MPSANTDDLRETLAGTKAEAEQWAEELATLGEAPDGEAAKEPERRYGMPMWQALAVDIVAQRFAPLIISIADRADDELAALAAAISSRRDRPWQGGRVIHPRFDASLGWCAAERLDMDAARSAVAAVEDTRLREQLTLDLEPLQVLADDGYSRLLTREQIGELAGWLTAGTGDGGSTINEPLPRLGQAGVLHAAGAVGWSPFVDDA